VTSITANTHPLRIGADSNGGSMMPGTIDEPRVWNRALSAAEIAEIYWQSSNCQ
jgi:hypothetical protein